jgi:ABC-2 type transport system ATP-binding protein
MTSPIISARNISKWYGQVIGLNNFNLDIMPGITGIVGPNGAGKTTFFKLITGMIKANVGELQVLGQRPWMNTAIHAKFGLCPDYDNLSDDMTGREFLKLTGGLHAMSGAGLNKRISEVTEIVGMTDAIGRKIGGYSKGMRQRIKIAATILHNPSLLLLDEPLAGTDPLARKEIIDLIFSLHREHNHNIIVSSHVLFEVERMTKNVALVYKGRAVASGHISEIRGLIDKHPHNIVIEGEGLLELAKKFLDLDYIVSVGFSQDKRAIYVQVLKPDEFFNDLPQIVAGMECNITRLHSLDNNLEAVFRYLVGW